MEIAKKHEKPLNHQKNEIATCEDKHQNCCFYYHTFVLIQKYAKNQEIANASLLSNKNR